MTNFASNFASFDMGIKNTAMCLESGGVITHAEIFDCTTPKLSPSQALSLHLDKHKSKLGSCSVVLIEQQMNTNVAALKLAQHVRSYMEILFPHVKVVDISSRLKTKGAPKGMTYSQRKKWCVEKATKILEDQGSPGLISKFAKKDDIADTICQLQAYKLKC